MKQKATILLSFLVLFLVCTSLSAQKEKVDWKNHDLLVDGKVYAKMKKITNGIATNDYSISSISGPELLYIKLVPAGWQYNANLRRDVQTWNAEFNFIGTGNKVVMTPRGADAYARIVYENNLVTGNVMDPEVERRFIQLFNGYFAIQPEDNQAPAQTIIVNVNTANTAPSNTDAAKSNAKPNKGPVSLDGKSILRDGETIGKFREELTTEGFYQEMRLVHVYNESGEKIAEAIAPAHEPQEWKITLLPAKTEVPLLYDAPNELENLFKWMDDKGYFAN